MDRRYELFAMVQLLAGADKRFSGFYRHDIPYDRRRRPISCLFSGILSWRGTPGWPSKASITCAPINSWPCWAILRASRYRALSDQLVGEMGGARKAEEFRLLLSDFARVSRFAQFFDGAAPERARLIKSVERQARRLDLRGKLERYSGIPVKAATP